jgi:hypothetical protein
MAVRKSTRIKLKPSRPGARAERTGVPMIIQEQSNWCWAACADMVVHYYGFPVVRQCDFANWLFGQSGCCFAPGSSLCNRPCSEADVSLIYFNWGIQSSLVASSVPYSVLDSETVSSRPVEVGLAWNGGGGHLVLVIQTAIVNYQQVVLVNDPDYGTGGILYSDLLTANGMGAWVSSWVGIRR